MCGRYTLATPTDELVEVFDVDHLAFERWSPRYNLAPTDEAPVIIQGPEGERRMGLMRWGLVPGWAEDPSIGNRMINARSESVARKPAFRDAFRDRRCLVPADGFYEWTTGEPGSRKTPWWIHRPGRKPFAFAGLWERWRPGGGGDPLVTFTILTTKPSTFVSRLHDRMPVVLVDAESGRRWLDPEAGADALETLLGPTAEDALEAWPVSTTVNRAGTEGAELIERAE